MTNGFKLRKYKGNCSYCGMYGHKASMCNKRTKSKGEKGMKNEKESTNDEKFITPFSFSCYICNIKGHKAIDCPNKKRGPNGGQNANKDEAKCALGYADIGLMCNEELDSALISMVKFQILSALISMEDEKNKVKFQILWVGNSGAACHDLRNWNHKNFDKNYF
jgi:hypothetical protein